MDQFSKKHCVEESFEVALKLAHSEFWHCQMAALF
jgi:hypothetical protein